MSERLIGIGKVVMVRSVNAGVFLGTMAAFDGDVVRLLSARRLWKWVGAASLSELATRGPSKPLECQFPMVVPEVVILGVCEILPVSEEAERKICEVPVWTA